MYQKIKIIVKPEDNLSRLDVFLTLHLESYSRSFLQKRIENGDVRIADKVCKKQGVKVKSDDYITVDIPVPEKWDIQAEDIPLHIIYEDQHIIVLNKSAGMTVHPGAGHHQGTLVNALMHHCGDKLSTINGIERPGIVHRLDKDTSGLLVVAKTDIAHQSLSRQFAEKTAGRTYRALVWFAPKEQKGKIETKINRDPKDRKRMAVSNDGRTAITKYDLLKSFTFCSLLELSLETGRTHQIRVHMKYNRTPVIGDDIYGGGKSFLNRIPIMDRKFAGHLLNGIPFFLLHARELSFVHPSTENNMHFQAEIPDYFENALEKLENREKNF